MRNRKKIWRKYETPETGMAYDIEKKIYDTLLKLAKEECYQMQSVKSAKMIIRNFTT